MSAVSGESGLRHKGYVIYHDGSTWVAEPFISDEIVLEMSSKSLDRIVEAIDLIDGALGPVDSMSSGSVPVPPWMQTYFDAGVHARIDLDVELSVKPEAIPLKEHPAPYQAIHQVTLPSFEGGVEFGKRPKRPKEFNCSNPDPVIKQSMLSAKDITVRSELVSAGDIRAKSVITKLSIAGHPMTRITKQGY